MGGKSPATRSKQKKSDVETEMEQTGAELDAQKGWDVEVGARVEKLEEKLEQSAA